jgi:hypothetical protein
MNYYAQGGQPYGIKSLAKELPNYGRYNDDMVAHISSDEARLLKAMGGAGTINPVTGLPEYGLKKIFKSVAQPIEKAIIRPIGNIVKPIAQDLGIVGQLAATYFGGPVGAGLYAGIAGGGKGFDFKRALMAGALAYGAQNLAQGLEGAGGGGTAGIDATASDVAANLGTEAATGAGSQSAMLADQAAGFGDAGLKSIQSGASYATPSGIDLVGNAADTTAGMAEAANKSAFENFTDKAGQTLSDYGSKLNNMSPYKDTDFSKVYEGAKGVLTGDKAALEGFKASGATLSNTAAPMFLGYSGMRAIDETQKMKDESDLANAKSQEEYNTILERIEASKQRGIEAVRNNPYRFAAGGSVDDEAGFDDFNNAPGIASMAKGGMPPRFLSGGGDGMSDDIKATINGKQPARLADGEFVVPADVVSHLGNGSSKAGAKQLYSMMDKVRHARTGNKKQGKQINPANYMPA